MTHSEQAMLAEAQRSAQLGWALAIVLAILHWWG